MVKLMVSPCNKELKPADADTNKRNLDQDYKAQLDYWHNHFQLQNIQNNSNRKSENQHQNLYIKSGHQDYYIRNYICPVDKTNLISTYCDKGVCPTCGCVWIPGIIIDDGKR